MKICDGLGILGKLTPATLYLEALFDFHNGAILTYCSTATPVHISSLLWHMPKEVEHNHHDR
jgi:hypothetical protein